MFLIGSRGNSKFLCNEIHLWDCKMQQSVGIIKLKLKDSEEILDMIITKFVIIIIIVNKILLFNLCDLSYICSLEDVNIKNKEDLKKITVTQNANSRFFPLIIAFPSFMNKSNIKIVKFLIGEDFKVWSKFQISIISKYKGIQSILASPNGELLAVVADKGHKIDVYSLLEFEIIESLWRGKSPAKILHLAFDDEGRYLALLSTNLTFHIYNLSYKSNSSLDLQPSFSFDDHEDNGNNFITNFFENFLDAFHDHSYKKSFATYRFEQEQLYSLENSICYFKKINLVRFNFLIDYIRF
jgi:WD40 repeat protein